MRRSLFHLTAPTICLLCLSIGLFAACLPLEGFAGWAGWSLLLLGTLGFFVCPANFTWLANPILFCAWFAILKGKKFTALGLSFIALAVSAAFLLAKTIVTDEGGMPEPVPGIGPGYWFWLASTAVAWLAALFNLKTPVNEHMEKYPGLQT